MRKGDKKFLDFSILGSNYPHFWLIFTTDFGLTGKNGGQKKITKFAKKLAKSIGFVLEWYQWAG